jgi:hypothetical protein
MVTLTETLFPMSSYPTSLLHVICCSPLILIKIAFDFPLELSVV